MNVLQLLDLDQSDRNRIGYVSLDLLRYAGRRMNELLSHDVWSAYISV